MVGRGGCVVGQRVAQGGVSQVLMLSLTSLPSAAAAAVATVLPG